MSERLALSLWEVLDQVPEPRKARGQRHPLAAILSLAMCAMLGGCRSLYVLAQWGREPPELAQALGFIREQTPGVATLHLRRPGNASRHGGRKEQRWLRVSTALADYLDWPGLQQVCCRVRSGAAP